MQLIRLLKKDALLLLLVLLIAALLRIDFLLASDCVIDSDEAIVGLMARHILGGAPIPVFYYGQHYMGSFEALVSSLLFAAFGISSCVLKVTPFIFSLILIVVVYLIAALGYSRRAARYASILVAIPPSTLIIWSLKARGGFIEIVVIGAVAALLTVRWLQSKEPSISTTVLIGLVLGFGWWVNNQIIYFMLPVGCLMLLKLLWQDNGRFVAVFYHFFQGLTAFFIGGAPFWVYNLKNDFASFGMFAASGFSDITEHIKGLFTVALPVLLGAKRYWQTADIFYGATLVAYLFYGALLVAVLISYRRSLGRLIKLKFDDNGAPVLLFILLFFSCLAVFVISSFGYLVEAPRYLLPAYVSLFVLCGVMLARISTRMPLFANAMLVVLVLFNLVSAYAGGRAIPGEPFVFKGERVSRNHSELISWLRENNVEVIRTNYWIGYRLAFETNETIRFILFQLPGQVRISSYQDLAKHYDRFSTPYVLVPAQSKLVKKALKLMGYSFKLAIRSGYEIIYDITDAASGLRPYRQVVYSVSASNEKMNPELAVDGDLSTRWGSAMPQRPGMNFKIDLKPGTIVNGLVYDLGRWSHDFPRMLRVEVVGEDGRSLTVLDPEGYRAIQYFMEGSPRFRIIFKREKIKTVIFYQDGRDPVFDWSIAEVRILH
ncbi:MAG: hypothetical protein D6719_08710 [Candidatus Dadabacteria bacterium]|nr:MAG: hypothetical protein D6719_08710 [Candidatus Dadabacteria bacterium]